MKIAKMVGLLILATGLGTGGKALAHCDTMAGPVVKEALAALAKGEVAPVLKWVRPADEKKVERAFRKALRGKKAGPAEKDPAAREFLKTLVRLHRESEGEPFTDLKPADAPLEPGIREADEALQKGSSKDLADALAGKVREQVRRKFERVVQTRKHAGESVEKGREYVAAYVDFLHTVERLHALLGAEEGHSHEHK